MNPMKRSWQIYGEISTPGQRTKKQSGKQSRRQHVTFFRASLSITSPNLSCPFLEPAVRFRPFPPVDSRSGSYLLDAQIFPGLFFGTRFRGLWNTERSVVGRFFVVFLSRGPPSWSLGKIVRWVDFLGDRSRKPGGGGASGNGQPPPGSPTALYGCVERDYVLLLSKKGFC